jgi:tetratricopeptide (TPR) repeat protein
MDVHTPAELLTRAAEAVRDADRPRLAEPLFRAALRAGGLHAARSAADERPQDASVRLRLAELALRSALLPEARVAAQTAAVLDPEDPRPHRVLASVARQVPAGPGSSSEEQHLLEARRLGAGDASLVVRLGQIALASGRREEALELGLDALDRDPRNADADRLVADAAVPHTRRDVINSLRLLPLAIAVLAGWLLAGRGEAGVLRARDWYVVASVATVVLVGWLVRRSASPRAAGALKTASRRRRIREFGVTVPLLGVFFGSAMALFCLVAAVVAPNDTDRAVSLVVMIPFLALTALGIRWFNRRNLVRRTTSTIHDPRSCICLNREVLDGDDARSYQRAHLSRAGRVSRRPALRCPSTGIVWLRLPPETERRDRGHVLVRASDPVAVPSGPT